MDLAVTVGAAQLGNGVQVQLLGLAHKSKLLVDVALTPRGLFFSSFWTIIRSYIASGGDLLVFRTFFALSKRHTSAAWHRHAAKLSPAAPRRGGTRRLCRPPRGGCRRARKTDPAQSALGFSHRQKVLRHRQKRRGSGVDRQHWADQGRG